jgi:uncharacterized membrane protein YkoI
VQAGQAVPLTTILGDLKARGAGEIIDAQLIRAQGFLLYAVKVLSGDGKVATEYYYARTGRRVEVK